MITDGRAAPARRDGGVRPGIAGNIDRYLSAMEAVGFSGAIIVTHGGEEVDAGLFRQPDVSGTQTAFVDGNDVWVVAREGATVHRLSSPDGAEAVPRFSPDGTNLAFSGNHDGDVDGCTISAGGRQEPAWNSYPVEFLSVSCQPQMLND